MEHSRQYNEQASHPIKQKVGGIDTHCRVSVFEALREQGASYESGNAIDHHNRTFLSLFGRYSRRDNIILSGRTYGVPDPRSSLANQEYDADYAICLYHDLGQAGEEIAYLLSDRRQKFHHVFVISQQWTEEDEVTKKGLSAITTNTYTTSTGLTLPYPDRPVNTDESDETFDLEEAGRLSFWHINDIRNQDKRDAMMSKLI